MHLLAVDQRWLMRLILLSLLSGVLCTCGPAPAPDGFADLPWAEATYLDPMATELTFVNNGEERLGLRADLRDYFVDLDLVLPDSLAGGEEATVRVELTAPIFLILRYGGLETMRVVLPGHSRSIAHDGMELTEGGSDQAIYDYLDAALTPINPVGTYPPEITSVTDYHKVFAQELTAHLDSIPRPTIVPEWVERLVRQEVELTSFKGPLQIRSYRRFLLADTLSVDPEYMDAVSQILKVPLAYQAPSYLGLHFYLTNYHAETGKRQAAEAATRNYWSYTEALLDDYPVSDKRDDATAAFLSRQISWPYMYGGKAQIIDTLTASLPAAYREKIAAFADVVAKRNASEEGLRAFLDTPLENDLGASITPLDIRQKEKTLYKFWFAGCYPCIVQQPYERELLAAHPELEIVYVAYATDKDDWLPYLEAHDAPAMANLYVPEGQTELVQAALGRLGAPTYLLLDGAGEVICTSCPKPSDPAFRELL